MAKLNKKPIHRTIVIAPHPDDELLGCGGTLLRRGHEGSVLAWVIVTSMHESSGFSARSIQSRAEEVEKVRAGLKISKKNLYELNFPTTALDIIPLSKIIESISHVFEE
ncbi:PIG-L family deacetylase, partial [Gammaproteobacteria bacterium]|nr:PIG-L family deacetylase [Gammaproteobacteria bacterium]